MNNDEDAETAMTPKRPSAMKFLNNMIESKDEIKYDSDSDDECGDLSNRLHVNLRAHSPSPIRKRGSLHDLFTQPQTSEPMAMTHSLIGNEI